MNNLYKQNQGTIYDRINHFKSSAVSFDDLVCVANLAFVEAFQSWDQTLSKFNTHLYNTLNIKLRNYIKKEKKRFYREICADSFIFDKTEFKQTYDHYDRSSLTDHAKEIIKIVLDPSEKVENSYNKISKESIYNHLRKDGWRDSEILKGFRSIEQHIQAEV
jgi:DNA-directed RNA polymerase specialized sigma subunit